MGTAALWGAKIRAAMGIIVQVQRDKATGVLEFELKELENLFMVMITGSLIGLPSPPVAIACELLPYLEKELQIMISRADFSQDPLGSLLALLEID